MSQASQVIWCAVALAAVSTMAASAQEPLKKAKASADEVETLINQLTALDRQDTGYSSSRSGSGFLPLGQSETHTMLLFQQPEAVSEPLKSLVKMGMKSLPKLLEHLSDKRPTKIVLNHGGGFGGMFVTEDEDERKKKDDGNLGFGQRQYTVMVGDLCYVAVGQIVNRNYWAVRYQPTAIIMVNSVPRSKELREQVIKEWGQLTPEKHQASFARDVLDSNDESIRNGASLRLAYYYPEALETVALKQLARPTYSVFTVHDLIRHRLYATKDAKERKRLVDEFVRKNGDHARDGVRWALFDDLETQEADEEGRVGPKLNPRYQARECLIDAFGLPKSVKSGDRPKIPPLSESEQARFIQTLHYDNSAKLDHALRDLLARTSDDYTTTGCLDRLVGRGFDADIEAYLKRRLPHLKDREYLLPYESKLGWTRLHAAVDLKLAEYVERALNAGADVDAQARDGRTALHLAAADGNAVIIDILLRAKANATLKDKKEKVAAQVAAYEDHVQVVRKLLAKDGSVRDILVGAISGSADTVDAVLKEVPDAAKQRNAHGYTPLHVAAREGHADVIHRLLASGADPKTVDVPKDRAYSNGWTPLHLVALSGKTAVAELLLDRGADVNAVDKRGKHTPLHFAAWQGHIDLVKLLLARKADPNAMDSQQRTPLALAKERERTAVVKLLEKGSE